jgi:hypothetical protein
VIQIRLATQSFEKILSSCQYKLPEPRTAGLSSKKPSVLIRAQALNGDRTGFGALARVKKHAGGKVLLASRRTSR